MRTLERVEMVLAAAMMGCGAGMLLASVAAALIALH